jgi:hypothetical protein
MYGGTNTYLYVRAAPLSLIDPSGLCPDDDKDKCDKLLAEMLNMIEAQRANPTDPKGMAQRYKQLGRGSLPADTRTGYEEQFQNSQRSLRKKIQKYIDEGCGNPPPELLEWANKEVPKLPVQVPDSSPDVPSDNQSTTLGLGALLSILSRLARIPL